MKIKFLAFLYDESESDVFRKCVVFCANITEKKMLAQLETSRKQGKYRDANEVISDMRSKYGL